MLVKLGNMLAGRRAVRGIDGYIRVERVNEKIEQDRILNAVSLFD